MRTSEKSAPAMAAAQIRKKLKEAGIPARVTSNSRGTSSVDVTTTDQAPEAAAETERIAAPYRLGNFDGMTDSYVIDNARKGLPQVRYVHVQNRPSEEMRQELEEFVKKRHGDGDMMNVHRVYAGLPPYGRAFWDAREGEKQR